MNIADRPPEPDQGDMRVRLHGLLGLTSRLSEPLPAEEVVRIVVDQAQSAVGAVTAMMWTVEDPPTHAKLVGASGLRPGAPSQYALIALEPSLPTEHAPSPGVANARRRHVRRRVVIVDDDPDAAATLAAAIARAGHEVRTVGDGPTALQLVETYVPDIALLDIELPMMDGYELAGLLRRKPSLARTCLVALTGYAGDGDRQRSLASGFDEHFAKPLPLGRALDFMEGLALFPRET